jgi:uncharacterized protein DUF4241
MTGGMAPPVQRRGHPVTAAPLESPDGSIGWGRAVTEGVSRRTLLVSGGGLAAVLAAGAVAVSLTRRDQHPDRARDLPGGSVLSDEELPVAPVPAPTDEPVEVVYCAGWDATTRRPVSPMSDATARAQDAAGAQYAIVLFVGGVARSVVEVCWAAHHAEVWNVDDTGRRYRGVAYRRWPDERLRLFEMRSWHSGGEEPTLRVRVGRDEHGTAGQVQTYAIGPTGSQQTVHDWPYWPEPKRPEESLAVPAVGDWPRIAGMTGPATVRPGPGTVPARFPWRPPRPLQPRYVTEMVTEGTRFRLADGTVERVGRVDAGTVRLPSGRLVVADPGWLHADATPLAETVPPGEYPVEVFQLNSTIACRIGVRGAPVASWHLALLEGDTELTLGDGEFYGNPVDTATLSIVDATGVPAYSEDEVQAAMAGAAEVAYRTITDGRTDLVIVSGWTDGAYPVWLGRTGDGTIASVVLDFMDPDLAQAKPV